MDKWLQIKDVRKLAIEDRLRPVLVRCGGKNGGLIDCRFTCPAQDAEQLINIIQASKKAYIRDISTH